MISQFLLYFPLFLLKADLVSLISMVKDRRKGERVQPLDPKIKDEINARVTNFGCHIQVDIIENGKIVVSLTYK